MKKKINVLSLFDGMSCAQIAINRLGIEDYNYYASELDKHAIKVTQANYPETIQLGDVTKVKSDDLPEIDLLIGGSPCQGFSFAGKQLNFDDPRSMLFFEYVRILKECKPKYFLLENVKMKKEYQDLISELLGVEPVEINSNLLSLQTRKRLYWTNIPDIKQPEGLSLKKEDIGICDKIGTIRVTKDKKRVVVEKEEIGCITARYTDMNGSSRPLVILDDNEIGKEFDSKKANIGYRMLSPNECEDLQTVDHDYTNHVSKSQRYKMLGNGFTVDVIAHILKGIK
jgi:site-specific DNA-cytosine methylase